VKHRLEYLAVRAVGAALRPLPYPAVRSCGAGLGSLFYLLDRPHRRIALANLKGAFPQWPAGQHEAIACEVFRHFGRLALELIKFGTLKPEEMLRRVEIEGEDRVRRALASGRGVLFFTGHFGFWELHAIVHGLRVGPIAVLARALDNPLLNALLERVRGCTGNTVIYRRGAIRRVMRELQANQGVALLIDQHIHTPEAVYVDFFNRPAATTSALAALAFRTKATVMPVFALPQPGGRYRLIYEHPVEPPPEETPDAILQFTQRCTDVLEMYVRRYPELWLWMHRRWRDGGPSIDRVPGMFPCGTTRCRG
jgi:Kdo2-lipid IVA lauroyltransferase/acyltransferase